MTRKGIVGRRRFPLLHGSWIAIAQNVAPGWFHARQHRRMEENQHRLLTSSDLPTFVLAGTASGETTTRVVSGSMRIKRGGPLGLHRLADGAVTSLQTVQRIPAGGELRVASQRRRHDVSTEPDDRQRALMIHNFLARLGLLADDARVAWQEVDFSPGQANELLAFSDDAWRPFEIVIDGEPQDFERVTIDRHWLALGTVGDAGVAIEGHNFDPDRLQLVRMDRPAG